MAGIKARFTAGLRLSSLALALVLASSGQDLPPVPPAAAGASAIRPGIFGGHWSFSTASNRAGTDAAFSGATIPGEARLPSRGIQGITLEQVKQSADRAAGPLQRLGLLTVEAARQHRLAA